MRRDLRAFVRIDDTNRVVPGSLVLRKHAPDFANDKNGRWLEIKAYACCAPPGSPGGSQEPMTIAVPTLTAPNSYTVAVASGGLTSGTVNTGVTTPAALVNYLTTNYGGAGTYVLDGTNIIFTPSTAGGTLTLGQALNGVSIALPALGGGTPNYHVEFTNSGMTTGDLNSSTTTGAALVTWLTTNHANKGTYTLNGTNVIFKAAATGTTLAITAGA